MNDSCICNRRNNFLNLLLCSLFSFEYIKHFLFIFEGCGLGLKFASNCRTVLESNSICMLSVVKFYILTLLSCSIFELFCSENVFFIHLLYLSILCCYWHQLFLILNFFFWRGEWEWFTKHKYM